MDIVHLKERMRKGLCPLCGKPIVYAEFRDSISLQEYDISGMCQTCQDEFFDEEDE